MVDRNVGGRNVPSGEGGTAAAAEAARREAEAKRARDQRAYDAQMEAVRQQQHNQARADKQYEKEKRKANQNSRVKQQHKSSSRPPKSPQPELELSPRAGVLAFVVGFIFLAGYVKATPLASLVGALVGALVIARYYRQFLGLAAAVMLIMILVSSQKGKQTDVEGDPVASFKAQEVAPVMSGTPVASSLGNTAESSALLANESVADSAGTKDTVPAASTMTIERPKQPRHINTPLDDRLFNPAVYAMLSDHDRVDGGFVGERYTGQVLSREKLAEIAVERFEEQAEFLGIERGDITRAMLEGAFNPYAVDALLVAQGVGQAFAGTPEKPVPPAQSKSGRSATVEETDKHHAAVMQYRADISNYRNEIDGYRSAAWGERYGRVRDIEDAGVSTIIDGVERRVSGNDLALRMVQKSTSGSNLEALGLSNDVTLTYKEAARVVETKSPKLQQYFHDRMELMRGLCPVQYFDLTYHDWRHYVRDSVDGYATYADYRQLRATKYIGRLRSLGYVTTSKVEVFTAGEY